MGSESVIAFDIGGTWFRSALVTKNGELLEVDHQPSVNYLDYPDLSAAQLQEALVDYLVGTVARLRSGSDRSFRLAAISLGAALNAHTGKIFTSGPLWGPECRPFDLLGALRRRDSTIEWGVVNDVTAALLRHVSLPAYQSRNRVALVTVSTGIAMRTYDAVTQDVPTDPVTGLQGEIGHIEVHVEFRGQPLKMTCDCGGENHLNAFSSGRGIRALLATLCSAYPEAFRESRLSGGAAGPGESPGPADLFAAAEAADPFALEILDAAIRPLATILFHAWTVDPLIDRWILTGGVVRRLGQLYVRRLQRQLGEMRLFGPGVLDHDFLSQRLVLGVDDDASGLLGAAIAARSLTGSSSSGHGAFRRRVRAWHPGAYVVREVPRLLDPQEPALMTSSDPAGASGRRLIVVDHNVGCLFGNEIRDYFEANASEYRILSVACEENRKTMEAVDGILEALNEFGVLRRGEPVIAIGGGIVLDLAGFAASLYRRGIPYLRVPTTLLAYVDAGLGVKTGINYGGRKSKIGTYYAPEATFLCREFLRTIDDRQMRNGMTEIVKVALCKDRTLFEMLEHHGLEFLGNKFQRGDHASPVLERAIGGMLDDLEPNLYETNLQRLMDLGHSFSPFIEMHALPKLQHGEAVAIDMALTAHLSAGRGCLSRADLERILALFRLLGLPVFHEICTPSLLEQALDDVVRHRGGRQRIPLLAGIGEAIFVDDLAVEELVRALRNLSGEQPAP